jgi:hypothetical protein
MFVAFASIAGCASTPGVVLPDGTLMLGEVRRVLTAEMVRAGELAPGAARADLAQALHSRGWTDAQVEQGRIVVLRTLIYWNNTVCGIKHSQLAPQLLAQGLAVEPGKVVEFTVGEPDGAVQHVRARSLAEGSCYYGDVPVGATVEAMVALSLVGPRGSASLYCAGIEKDGWQRPRTYWYRLPGSAPPGPGSAAVPPVAVNLEPAPALDTSGMVMLMLLRNRAEARSMSDRPVWVDGSKAAVLASGECEVVLLVPGEHLVTAGTDEFFGMPRRELVISAATGERIVVSYLTDQQRFSLLGMAGLVTPREVWEAQVFSFTQWRAGPSDACAIRHAPTVLSGPGVAAAEAKH